MKTSINVATCPICKKENPLEMIFLHASACDKCIDEYNDRMVDSILI